MSLEIIEYTYNGSNSESEIIGTIKQRTGLELTVSGPENNAGMTPFNARFPDMEESQRVDIRDFTFSGAFFKQNRKTRNRFCSIKQRED